MNTFNQFTNLYKRTITLGFRLEPVTVVNGNIVAVKDSPYDALLTKDQTLQNKYLDLKPAIDAYHRYFTDCGLRRIIAMPAIDENGKKTQKALFMERLLSASEKAELDDANINALKASVTTFLSSNGIEKPETLKNAEFLTRILHSFVERDENEIIRYFNNERKNIVNAKRILNEKDGKLYANCSGLLEARLLMYGNEGKSVSVPHRCIAVNLPKFLYDANVFKKYIEGGVLDIEKLNSAFTTTLQRLSSLSGQDVTSVEQIFDINFYPCYMVQEGIEIINAIIGKERDKKHSAGINQCINEYNQKIKNEKKRNKDNGLRTLPLMKQLFDQILFGNGLYIPQIEDYSEVRPLIDSVLKAMSSMHAFDGCCQKNKIYSLLLSLKECREEGIFVSARSVTTISNSLWGDWSILHSAVKRDKNGRVLQKSISMKALNDYITSLNLENNKAVIEYFNECKVHDVANENKQTNLFSMLENCYKEYVNADLDKLCELNDKQLFILEQLMDSIMVARRFISVFAVGAYEDDADGYFYKPYGELMETMADVEYKYNLIRNFFRRKPFNQDKLKVHFGKNVLLGNWPEQDKKGTYGNAYIFRVSHNGEPDYEYDYYLGIGNERMFSGKGEQRENRTSYREYLHSIGDLSMFERYYYYQMQSNTFKGQNFKNANGSFPAETDSEFVKMILKEVGKNEKIMAEVRKLKKESPDALGLLNLIDRTDSSCVENLLQSPQFSLQYHAMLERWRKGFMQVRRIKAAGKYAEEGFVSHKEVNTAINDVCNRKLVEFIPVSTQEMYDHITSGKLYLFRITNKDLSYAQTMKDGKRKSRGKENLHTMYFRALMDPNQTTFDIGVGEVFHRKASTKLKYNEDKPTHQAGQAIRCKKDKTQERTFEYPLIKDKHYTKDTYLFHLSIFQNYSPSMSGGLNENVRKYLRAQNPLESIHVIGIDRGERNLLYMTMLDEEGNIVEQKSYNAFAYEGTTADGKPFKIDSDYHALLKQKAGEMKEQQKHWQTVDNIKDLKTGYLSHVVHELAKLMVEKQAIIVMEDLSQGFFSTRHNQMANVYQDFERMLESKLSYVVTDKSINRHLPGGLCNGYQLAQENMNGVQNGFIFYVPAWMTSKIDPVTGFVNLFSFSYTNREKARVFFGKFKSIKLNPESGDFEFCFRYKDFAKLKVTQQVTCPDIEWVVSTYGKRIERTKTANGFTTNPIENLTDRFTELFLSKGLDITGDIKEQLISKDDAELYEKLVHLFKLMMQMRNTDDKSDYIISPVCDPITHKHFDSSEYDNLDKNQKEHNDLPIDADANGAYNIARKGLIALRQIREGKDKFKVDRELWLEEAQKNMPKYSE